MSTKLRAYLRLARLPNTLSASANVFAGAALAGASPLSSAVILAALGSALIYAGGVALNDVLDIDKDRHTNPDRPLPQGLVSTASARVFAILLLAAGSTTALVGPGIHMIWTAGLVACVLAYDTLADRLPVVGPILMGLCRAANVARGISLAGASDDAVLIAPVAIGTLVLLVTAVSTLEEDPARGGWRLRPLAILLALAYGGPALLAVLHSDYTGAPPLLLLVAGLVLAVVVTRPAFLPDAQPGRVVYRGVFSLVLLDSLFALAAGELLLAGVLGATLPLMKTLARWISQPGS